ncbi:hypothetical protein D9M68_776530 [compost metagenome]
MSSASYAPADISTASSEWGSTEKLFLALDANMAAPYLPIAVQKKPPALWVLNQVKPDLLGGETLKLMSVAPVARSVICTPKQVSVNSMGNRMLPVVAATLTTPHCSIFPLGSLACPVAVNAAEKPGRYGRAADPSSTAHDAFPAENVIVSRGRSTKDVTLEPSRRPMVSAPIRLMVTSTGAEFTRWNCVPGTTSAIAGSV